MSRAPRDPELDALVKCDALLRALPAKAAHRVLRTIAERAGGEYRAPQEERGDLLGTESP